MSYYTDTVARGLDDYYSGRGEAPGRWLGRGAVVLGLDGEITAEELTRLFTDGVHPRRGEGLGADYEVRDGADKVLGWDLTFSAPKSVSVLWAVAAGEIGVQVRDAHDAAVRAGLAYLEEHAAFARAGKAGIRQVDTDGLVGAAFVHRSSRAGDPQLHTHVLVSGRVRATHDGVWRALDSRALHRELKPAGTVYQAALRAELTARLGLEWEPVSRHGQADIAGVPRAVRNGFSKRARAVEARARELIAAAEVELGRSLTDAGRRRIQKVAVLETRPAKRLDGTTGEGLLDQWRAEAMTAGANPDSWLPEVLNRVPSRRPLEPESVVDVVVAELRQEQSTWTRRDVIRVAARHAPAENDDAEHTRQWIELLADRVVGHATVVALQAPEPPAPSVLRRRDGLSQYEHHGAARYSTDVTLAVEQQVLDIVTAGRGAGRGVAHPVAVGAALVHAHLGEDQAAAVRTVSLDGDTVTCVVGPAGAGKSRMLGAAFTAWEASRIPVRGLAVSAAAAGVLTTETGIAADTIAKFLHEQDRPGGPDPAWLPRPGEVLVVDEASMIASADLARLVLLAEKHGGKVVLVGDWAQLGAVDAGGLFRLLANDQAVELTSVRRFRHGWERDASRQLRARDPAVLAEYDENGRIFGGLRQAMLEEAFTRWQTIRARGETVVLCAADQATVDELAVRCQTARMLAGEVERNVVPAGDHAVAVGDEVVTCRNERRLVTTGGGWVRNGDRWTVHAVDADGAVTVEDATGRGRIRLPADYAADHVSLAYAVTIHKAQGVTVDHALVIVDGATSAEGLYVGMTRGRESNTALVLTDDDAPDHGPSPVPPSPTDVLAQALARVTAERTAIEELRDRLARSESLAVLKPRLANLDGWIRHHAPPDRAAEIERLDARRQHIATHPMSPLTRDGRELRKLARRLDQQAAQLEARQQHRLDWFHEHADVIAYRAQLAATIADRRRDLGDAAIHAPPEHLVRVLGSVPDDPSERHVWATRAARIEAYREEWGIEPNDLDHAPLDAVQYREWETAGLHELDVARRLAHTTLDHGLERGLGVEL